MAIAYCRNEDCDKDPWELEKPPDEYSEGPRCSACGSRNVEIDREDDMLAALGPVGDSKKDRLEEAVAGLPGVGDNGVRHITKLWENYESVREPDELRSALLRLKNVDDWAADLVVREVFEGEQDSTPPSGGLNGGGNQKADATRHRPAPPQNSGTDPIEAIAALAEAGVIGGESSGGGESDTQEIVDSLGAVLDESMSQVAQTQKQLAAAIQQDSGSGEVEELKREIRELKEAEKEDRIARLESKLEDLRTGGDEDPQTVQIKESADIQRKSLEVAHDTLDKMPERVAQTMEEAVLPLLHRYAPPEEAVYQQLWQPPDSAPTRERMEYDPGEPSQRAAATDGGEEADDPPEPPEAETEADGEYAEQVADKLLDGDNTEG